MKEVNKFPILMTFLMLFLTSSYAVYYDQISSALTIGIWVVMFVVLILNLKNIRTSNLLLFIMLLSIYILSCVYNEENVINATKYAFSFCCAYLYVENFKFGTMVDSVIKVMRISCTISLILFTLYTVIPQLSNLYYVINNGRKVSSLLIYTHTSTGRNQGMFWEPGAFQTFILLAMMFELLNSRLTLKSLILYTLSLVTTFSTTGYLGLMLIAVLILWKKGYLSKSLKRGVYIAIIVGVIVLIFNWRYLFDGRYSVFGKIVYFFENREYEVIGSNFTTTIRYNALTKPIEAFFKSPILGMGIQGLTEYTYAYTKGMNTCTFINYFAAWGGIYGIIAMKGYCGLLDKFTNRRLYKMLLFVFLFLITMSENYIFNATFLLFVLYGLQNRGKIKTN